MIKPAAPLLALFAAVVVSVPAHADPGAGDPGFFTALRDAGIAFDDPAHAVAAAQAVCGLAANGKPGLEVLQALTTTNPGFTMDGAAQFAAIAASAYCPHQLTATVTK